MPFDWFMHTYVMQIWSDSVQVRRFNPAQREVSPIASIACSSLASLTEVALSVIESNMEGSQLLPYDAGLGSRLRTDY